MKHSSNFPSRLSRREVVAGQSKLVRPPWSHENSIQATCDACGQCQSVCPQGILVKGPAGTPIVDFSAGACTFCGACAQACHAPVFRETANAPWAHQAKLGQDCLLQIGITCQSCTDACDAGAMQFDMRLGLAGDITIDIDQCTGCGACYSVCPTRAISFTPKVTGTA